MKITIDINESKDTIKFNLDDYPNFEYVLGLNKDRTLYSLWCNENFIFEKNVDDININVAICNTVYSLLQGRDDDKAGIYQEI